MKSIYDKSPTNICKYPRPNWHQILNIENSKLFEHHMFLYLYGNNKVAAYKTVRKEKNIFCIELDETLLVFPCLKNSMKKIWQFYFTTIQKIKFYALTCLYFIKKDFFNSVTMSLLQLNSAITKKRCSKPKCLAKKEKKNRYHIWKLKECIHQFRSTPPRRKKSPKNHETNKEKTNCNN